jgi:glutathione S-transferase
MFTLYHHPLSPFCRKIRLLLAEKDMAFTPVIEKPWERRAEFIALSPSGEVPLLLIKEGFSLNDTNAICEYLEEIKDRPNLLGDAVDERARIRSMSGFFDRIFYQDVGNTLLSEKALKRLQGMGTPDALTIRKGYAALDEHMKYINWLAEQNNWLAGDDLTLVDIAAAAQISVIDYLGDVMWDKYDEARMWYARIKSRPSFRPLLADHIPGLPPPSHYANLDF